MIEREFLFWVIVGTSLISYGCGYFLWLFVHWYYDERPKKLAKGTEWIVTYTVADGVMLSKPKATKIDPKLSPAKTSGEPEKKGDDRLPPKEKPDPYWAVVSPKGRYLEIIQAPTAYEAEKQYAEKKLGISTMMMDSRGFRVVEYKPTSPPPPPSPLYSHLFHYERKPNA